MPVFLIRNDDEMPKFAKIDSDNKKIIWADQADGTGFPTPEAATTAFEEACSAMLKIACAKLAKAENDGQVSKTNYGGYALKKDLGKSSRHTRGKIEALELFCLHWLVRKSKRQENFHVASRATHDDLLSVFENFYVRIDDYNGAPGWLGRPQRKGQTGLGWEPSFSLAVPFSSREAAAADLQRFGKNGHIVKTSCVFTQVEAVGKPRPDDVCSAIGSACEARDIEEIINESARARLQALRGELAPEANPPPVKKRARL